MQLRKTLFAAAALAIGLAGTQAARADWYDHGGYPDHGGYYDGWHDHDWHGGGYYPPPRYYAPPPVYYAPPRYYAPPPVYYAPPIITFGFRP